MAPVEPRGSRLELYFRSIHDPSSSADEDQRASGLLVFDVVQQARGTGTLTVRITTSDIEVAAEVVQDLAAFMGLSSAECRPYFPVELERLELSMRTVTEHDRLRSHLTAEIADESESLKLCVVRAEDARSIGEAALLREHCCGRPTSTARK